MPKTQAWPSARRWATVGLGGAVPETRHPRTCRQVIGVPDPLVLVTVRHFYDTGESCLFVASGPNLWTLSVKTPVTPQENSCSARS